MNYKIQEFITRSGESPFRIWLDSLDICTKARIQARVFRFECGNLGDYKPVGKGVLEARLHFSPGYRIYFAFYKQNIVILLAGGSKTSQKRDIKRAQIFLKTFLEVNKND